MCDLLSFSWALEWQERNESVLHISADTKIEGAKQRVLCVWTWTECLDGEKGLGDINISLLSTTTSFVLTNSSVGMESIGIMQHLSDCGFLLFRSKIHQAKRRCHLVRLCLKPGLHPCMTAYLHPRNRQSVIYSHAWLLARSVGVPKGTSIRCTCDTSKPTKYAPSLSFSRTAMSRVNDVSVALNCIYSWPMTSRRILYEEVNLRHMCTSSSIRWMDWCGSHCWVEVQLSLCSLPLLLSSLLSHLLGSELSKRQSYWTIRFFSLSEILLGKRYMDRCSHIVSFARLLSDASMQCQWIPVKYHERIWTYISGPAVRNKEEEEI